jgi:hypothetical protein
MTNRVQEILDQFDRLTPAEQGELADMLACSPNPKHRRLADLVRPHSLVDVDDRAIAEVSRAKPAPEQPKS